MTLANDLVQFLMHLFGDRQAAEEFLDDPERVLEDHGLGGVCSADVDAAMPVVLDYAPVTVNASREYNTGGNTSSTDHNGGGGSTGGGNNGGGHHGGGHHGGGHDHDDHAHAIQQLHHVVNNYSYTSTVDDRDTITDQSVNQNIWADGDVEQWFDNDSVVASGDRAIAAGDDADVDDSNNIEDSYNEDNSSDNSTDNSIRAGGDVNIGNERTDIDDSFNTDLDVDIDESFNDESDNSTNDSYNDESDNSIDVRDSGNDNSVNDSYNDNSDNSLDFDATLENVGNETNELENVGNETTSLENFANETTSLENFANDNSNDESLSVGDIDYTEVEVDADLNNVGNDYNDESLTVGDIQDNNVAVAEEEATIEN